MISPELGQYGAVGICIALIMVIWYLITKLTDAQNENTKAMIDVMRSNTAAMESIKTMIMDIKSIMLSGNSERGGRG